MKILVVNDDSISAPGIALLAKAAACFGEVTVVAPSSQCSAMSQKLTLREPLLLEEAKDFPVDVSKAYRLGGTPVDCVKVALNYILEDKPDWVFSGINNGYNVGFDIDYSGTLGAAFEASRNGIPAAAFSIAGDKHLPGSEAVLMEIIRELLDAEPEAGAVWNVNFPQLASRPLMGILRDRPVARTSLYRERYDKSPQSDGSVLLTTVGIPTPDADISQGSDAEAVRAGYISISRIRR